MVPTLKQVLQKRFCILGSFIVALESAELEKQVL